ncbi:C39 family peptidase [Sutcliffiella cohnii]|uniref:Peptidase C39-like domain-containing protein n=1 Tax=Sutcliffiella cohnii TaxID=33932 RepID=A0A223KWN0_9BACI|nr:MULTISPECIES: C39 family peptidase [Sutcliffiella]AST93859.1 hypothetical protein BC6307_22570 [Sutcliffiella cohnii]MED4015810.1 C39 family peptidase [Sutcliffiella cohnii]WBL15051.1 C39 family peptidase [Sutcliffiella sp. NC1]
MKKPVFLSLLLIIVNVALLMVNNAFAATPVVSVPLDEEEKAELKNGVSIPVETILQNPELPNGCEITSLTAVLQFCGYSISKTEMADDYLTKVPFFWKDGKLIGGNPYEAYAGDPRRKDGFFSYAPPIVDAARTYIADVGGKETVKDLSGSTPGEIMEYLQQGNPVVIWVTLDLSPPKVTYSWHFESTEEKFQAPVNLHAVVLNGYENGMVHVMDPLKGQVTHDAIDFFNSYIELGSHALVVIR